MRKFLVFSLLFAIGLFVLLRLDKSQKADPDPSKTRVENVPPGPESSDTTPQGPESPENLPSDQNVVQNTDGWTPTYREPGPSTDGSGESVFGLFGGFSSQSFDEATGAKRYSLECRHAEPVGDPAELNYLMIDVEFQFHDPVTGEETLKLHADKLRGKLSIGSGGGVRGVGGGQDLEMRGVVVDVPKGHALAPFRWTAPYMRTDTDLVHLTTEGEEPVELSGQGVIAKGWNLSLDRSSGQLNFLGGGDFTFEAVSQDTIHFATDKGTPLHLSHEIQDSLETLKLRVVGRGLLDITGKSQWKVESQGLGVQVIRQASGNFDLDRLDTTGLVRVTRGNNIFSGDGVRFVRQENGQRLDLQIANNPKAEVSFDAAGGEDSRVSIRGAGPMVVHGEDSAGVSEQAELELRGGGTIHFPGDGNPLTVTFRETLNLWVDRLHKSGTFDARGNVHIQQGEDWLRTGALDSIVWSAEQNVADVVCEGKTTARVFDATHGNLDFEAEQGALLQVQGDIWRFPQASGVHTTRAGNAPLEVRAQELRDLDWEAQTFRAWGSVVLQNPIGAVRCERIEAKEGGRLDLFGSEERPALLELVSGQVVAEDVISGSLSALEIGLVQDSIECVGMVRADLRTLKGDLRHGSERMTLTLGRTRGEPSQFQLAAQGSTHFSWEVGIDEKIELNCQDLLLGATRIDLADGEEGDAGFFNLTAREVSSFVQTKEQDTQGLSATALTLEGTVQRRDSGSQFQVRKLKAEEGFSYTEKGSRELEATGASLVFDGESRELQILPGAGEQVVASGWLPQSTLPFRISASNLELSETRLQADNPEVRVGLSLLPAGRSGGQPAEGSFFRAGSILATEKQITFDGGVFVTGSDLAGVPLSLRTDRLIFKGDLREVAAGAPGLMAMEELRAYDGFDLVYGGLARARGETLVVLPKSLLLGGTTARHVRVDLQDLYFETQRLVADLDDFLITTERGVMRGGATGKEWSMEYASLQPIQRGGETMFAFASPTYTQGARTARANWAMAWIHLDAWRARGEAELFGKPIPEHKEWKPKEVPNTERPDLIQNFLASLSGEELPHYL
ncbi:MAG: hypothetical protein KDB61_04900, partial [Planctomycetes bacterium]|nr:hypothetical protein [Planctomycetota bacterium]